MRSKMVPATQISPVQLKNLRRRVKSCHLAPDGVSYDAAVGCRRVAVWREPGAASGKLVLIQEIVRSADSNAINAAVCMKSLFVSHPGGRTARNDKIPARG